jgi:hypothetical protein
MYKDNTFHLVSKYYILHTYALYILPCPFLPLTITQNKRKRVLSSI